MDHAMDHIDLSRREYTFLDPTKLDPINTLLKFIYYYIYNFNQDLGPK